jgi:hypothetical protein
MMWRTGVGQVVGAAQRTENRAAADSQAAVSRPGKRRFLARSAEIAVFRTILARFWRKTLRR